MAAEAGSHLTQLAEGEQPSIFDILAAEGLSHILSPAVKHILKVIAQNRPATSLLVTLHHFSDELALLLQCLMHGHSLLTYKASFSEHFYGLTRTGWDRRPLSKWDKLSSLIFLVLTPYFKGKLDGVFERWREKYVDGHDVNKAQRIYIHIYPYLHAISSSLRLLYIVLYSVNKTKYSSHTFHLLHQTLCYSTLQEGEAKGANSNLYFQTVRDKISSTITATLSHLTQLISLSAFIVQFLNTYWHSDHTLTSQLGSLPVPPPPPALHNNKVAPNTCPVCLQPLHNPTALSTSGYVFCYDCIHKKLDKHNKCPVTGYTSTLDQLIRIYDVIV